MAGKVRIARKSTKGKGARWKKGHSSSSNPNRKTYREAARNRFFQFEKGTGGLTAAALKYHNDSQGAKNYDENMGSEKSEVESIGGQTADSFASTWSDCSNISFNRLISNWNATSSIHKEMLAVLAAITEVIKSKGGKETETEYFAALTTTLDTVDTDESIVICLLNMVIKRVPPSVLKLKFSSCSKTYLTLMEKYVNTDHNALLRALIGCTTTLLRVQEQMAWSNSSTVQVFNALLLFITHPKPKVRKVAQNAVCSILRGSAFMTSVEAPPYHPAAVQTAKFAVQKIEECGGAGTVTVTLHILGFLKSCISLFPKQQTKTACETVLKVMTLGNPLVVSCGMQALHGLFLNKPSEKNLTAELNARLINALYDYQPSINDAQPIMAWLTVMQEAFINLNRLDKRLCISNVAKYFGIAVQCWLSERREVFAVVTNTLKVLLQVCVQNVVTDFEAMVSGVGSTNTPAHQILAVLENALKYQYHQAWGHLLQVWAVCFEVLGKHCSSLMLKCLQTLAELRETYKFAYTFELDKCVGAAVRAMGPKLVLEAIPLKITGKNDNPEFPRSWLLPVLRDNIKEAELTHFIRYFLPLANTLHQSITEHRNAGHTVEAKSYEVLEMQIWALLPGFCTKPTDLLESFNIIAKTLGMMLNDRPELRLNILASLRLLINKNQENESGIAEMAKYSKNYLPIFFNLYTAEPDKNENKSIRLAVYDTIKVYLRITDHDLCNTLFEKVLSKLYSTDVTTFTRHSVLDLARALLSYIHQDHVAELYKYCNTLQKDEDRTLQKKAYRVMEELCSCSSPSCQEFIKIHLSDLQSVLLSSLSKSAPSSKAPRLRCLSHVLAQLQDPNRNFIVALIPEAILCTKETAEKARQAAYQLLADTCKAFLKLEGGDPQESFQKYLEVVIAGLAGSPHCVSATVLAISRLLYDFKDLLSSQTIVHLLETICTLLLSPTREVVQSTLSFIKVLFTILSPEDLAQHVEALISHLCSLTKDCQRHYRRPIREIFVRLVRKFGSEIIMKMVPESHIKMINNIRKVEVRKHRKKELQADDSGPEEDIKSHRTAENIEDLLQDSDDELPEEENEEQKNRPKKKARRRGASTWIEEQGDTEIIDFLDPSARQKVLSTDPTKVGKVKEKGKEAFPMTEDGKLIIKDDEDERRQKRKRANAEDADDLLDVLSGYKKKRKDSAGNISVEQPDDESKGEDYDNKKQNKFQFGNEFKAKKAGGDIKKKGKPDPYAYIPMDRQVLNKRKKAKFKGQFKNLVHAARKGAAKGMKGKSRKGKRK